MNNYNEIKLTGNIVKDCEVKYTSGGTFLCEFSLAHNFFKKNNADEWEQIKTIYMSCICFNDFAQTNEKLLKKGKKITVTGKFNIDFWLNREGVKQQKNKIVVKDIEYDEYKS